MRFGKNFKDQREKTKDQRNSPTNRAASGWYSLTCKICVDLAALEKNNIGSGSIEKKKHTCTKESVTVLMG